MPQGKGLYPKYAVYKIRRDGTMNSNHERNIFVLKPEQDAAALDALAAYTMYTPNEKLGRDLFDWIEKIRHAAS